MNMHTRGSKLQKIHLGVLLDHPRRYTFVHSLFTSLRVLSALFGGNKTRKGVKNHMGALAGGWYIKILVTTHCEGDTHTPCCALYR